MGLYLRRATEDDMDLLFEWANDDAVRKNAFHTEKIPYSDHVKWFAKMMADESVYQYILCEKDTPDLISEGKPVGQVRLDVEGDAAVITSSIRAGERGKGYGTELLRLVKRQAGIDKIPGVSRLVGKVKYENVASARACEQCGFAKKELPGFIQFETTVPQL